MPDALFLSLPKTQNKTDQNPTYLLGRQQPETRIQKYLSILLHVEFGSFLTPVARN